MQRRRRRTSRAGLDLPLSPCLPGNEREGSAFSDRTHEATDGNRTTSISTIGAQIVTVTSFNPNLIFNALSCLLPRAAQIDCIAIDARSSNQEPLGSPKQPEVIRTRPHSFLHDHMLHVLGNLPKRPTLLGQKVGAQT